MTSQAPVTSRRDAMVQPFVHEPSKTEYLPSFPTEFGRNRCGDDNRVTRGEETKERASRGQ